MLSPFVGHTAIDPVTISCWASSQTLIRCPGAAGLSKACDVYAFGVGVRQSWTMLAVQMLFAMLQVSWRRHHISICSMFKPFHFNKCHLQIIMFELFAGEIAFQGANLGHLIFQIGGSTQQSLALVRRSLCTCCTSSAGMAHSLTFKRILRLHVCLLQCTSVSGRLYQPTAQPTTQHSCRDAGRTTLRCGRPSRTCWRRCRHSSACCVPGGRSEAVPLQSIQQRLQPPQP